MDASEYQSFADLMRALPREAREKTVARGGFTRREDGHYACEDGLCVMAALLTDLGVPLVYKGGAPMTHPGAWTIGEKLAPVLSTDNVWNLVIEATERNDSGDLADPAAVRALLIPEDEA